MQAELAMAALYCFLVFFTSIILSFLLHSTLKKPTTQINHPPGPPALPIIGHLHLLLRYPVSRAFQALANRHGPLIRLRIAFSTAVIVSNAAVAKEMLKDNEMSFVSRPDFGTTDSDYNIYDGYPFVLAEYGNYWRFMKKLCVTELLSVPQVRRFADIRRQETLKLLEVLSKCSEGGRDRPCDLGLGLLTVANNVICRMAMSTCVSANVDESMEVWRFVKGIERVAIKFSLGLMSSGPLRKFDLFGYGRRLKSLLMEFDSLVERIMEEHEEDGRQNSRRRDGKDIMDILLQVHKDEHAETKLTRIGIKSFLLELFMAGTETTSVLLQWMMGELINHPKVFNKLRDEINGVVGAGSNRLVQESDVQNLPYLRAVVKEILRLHPPAPLIFRRCEKNCKINGYDILAKERIIVNLRAIMRDPNSWENPLEFVPERFMENNNNNNNNKGNNYYDEFEMDIKGRDFKIFPFGSGRRGCPGASLALAVIYQVTAAIVQCFDFEVHGGNKINMNEGKGFSAAMAFPLICYPIMHTNPLQLCQNI